VERAEEELSRARADLQAERDGRVADAIRFRDGLAEMQAAAEEAEAASQAAIAALRERLDEVRRRLDTIRETRG
jgi:hypothetical protein